MCEGLNLEHTPTIITEIMSNCPVAYRSNAVDCLAALHRARDLSSTNDDEATLDVEMASHYALACIGNVHFLAPGKLLLFPTPATLPDGQAWADTSEPDRPTAAPLSSPSCSPISAWRPLLAWTGPTEETPPPSA